MEWNGRKRRNDLRNSGTITEHKKQVQQIETDHYAVKKFEKQYGNGKKYMSYLTKLSCEKMQMGMPSVKV